jgi:outer membrane protein TolC
MRASARPCALFLDGHPVALQGVQREAQGGRRTTVDVLNTQQDLIQAKARLAGALRDRVIASDTLLVLLGGRMSGRLI